MDATKPNAMKNLVESPESTSMALARESNQREAQESVQRLAVNKKLAALLKEAEEEAKA